MKRETGENPVRTRHRILRAEAIYHWDDREGSLSVRAISRETCLSQYRNEKFRPREIGSTKWSTELYVICEYGIIQFYFRCLRFLAEAFLLPYFRKELPEADSVAIKVCKRRKAAGKL